jgi:hypothetical protein
MLPPNIQSQLEEFKIEISNVSYSPNQISLFRQNQGSSFEIKLLNVAPQVIQLVILLSQPESSIELVEEEVERIIQAFTDYCMMIDHNSYTLEIRCNGQRVSF